MPSVNTSFRLWLRPTGSSEVSKAPRPDSDSSARHSFPKCKGCAFHELWRNRGDGQLLSVTGRFLESKSPDILIAGIERQPEYPPRAWTCSTHCPGSGRTWPRASMSWRRCLLQFTPCHSRSHQSFRRRNGGCDPTKVVEFRVRAFLPAHLLREGYHSGLGLDSDAHHRACDRGCVPRGQTGDSRRHRGSRHSPG